MTDHLYRCICGRTDADADAAVAHVQQERCHQTARAFSSATGHSMTQEDIRVLHHQLASLKRGLMESGTLPANSFPVYDAIGVTPLHVGYSKARHYSAIMALSEDLRRALKGLMARVH